MNTSKPTISRGSIVVKRQQTNGTRFNMGVVSVLAVHLVVFAGLLIQGCEREHTEPGTAARDATESPLPDTNQPSFTEQNPETNPAVPTPMVAVPTLPTLSALPDTNAPAAQMTTKSYAVVNGDSFYKIAKAKSVSVRALSDANPGVDSARLRIGQVLQVPVSGATPTATSALSTALASKTSRWESLYVVKSGDTLSSIAKAKGTTIKSLKAGNGLRGDRIVAGTKLKIHYAKAAVASAPQG
jgi:LysM repeat protein